MKSNFPAAFGIGLVVIAVAVGGVLYMQRGSKVDLPGKILKVRTAPLDENSSVVVIDFRTANPSAAGPLELTRNELAARLTP